MFSIFNNSQDMETTRMSTGRWTDKAVALYMFICLVAHSCDSCIFNFLRNLQSVFHCRRTSWQSHQQCTRVPFFPRPLTFAISSFLMLVILTGVKWYLTPSLQKYGRLMARSAGSRVWFQSPWFHSLCILLSWSVGAGNLAHLLQSFCWPQESVSMSHSPRMTIT